MFWIKFSWRAAMLVAGALQFVIAVVVVFVSHFKLLFIVFIIIFIEFPDHTDRIKIKSLHLGISHSQHVEAGLWFYFFSCMGPTKANKFAIACDKCEINMLNVLTIWRFELDKTVDCYKVINAIISTTTATAAAAATAMPTNAANLACKSSSLHSHVHIFTYLNSYYCNNYYARLLFIQWFAIAIAIAIAIGEKE